MIEAERGYVAAYLDGEGSLGIHLIKRNDLEELRFTVQPKISFANRNLTSLQWVKEKIGFGYLHKVNASNNRQGVWELTTVNPKDIAILLTEILPYLIIKKEHAALMLEFIRTRTNRVFAPGKRVKGMRIPLKQSDLDFVQKMRTLNQRGNTATPFLIKYPIEIAATELTER